VEWSTLETPRDLAEWEAAWSIEPANGGASAPARVFLPPLLERADVAFLAARRAGRVVAGAVASRAAEVVGLSNLFARDPDADRLRAGCLARAVDAFPGLPVGGYALGSDLAAARALGFEEIGPLRVWVRSAARA
jgi:hypothetical protein